MKSDSILHSLHRYQTNQTSIYFPKNKPTMNGKMFIILIIFFCINCNAAEPFKTAEIRGSLLYERDIDKPVIINPNYVVYHRELNLEEILKAAELTKEFTEDYRIFCENLQNKISTDKSKIRTASMDHSDRYLITKGNHWIKQAPEICQSKGAMLPEIKSIADLHDLEKFAKSNNITNVHAGVRYDQAMKSHVYLSDNKRMTDHFTTVRYMDPDTNQMQETFLTTATLIPTLVRYPRLTYYFTSHKTWIYILNDKIGNTYDKIICEKYVEDRVSTMHDNFLLQITAHLCQRDYANIKGVTDLIMKETTLFTKSSETKDLVQEDSPYHNNSVNNTDNKCPKINCDTLACEQMLRLHDSIISKAQTIQSDLKYAIDHDVIVRYIIFRALNKTEITDFHDFLFFEHDISHDKNDYKNFFMSLLCRIELHTDRLKTLKEYDPFPLFKYKINDYIQNVQSQAEQIIYPEIFDFGPNFYTDNYPGENYTFQNIHINRTDISDYNAELQIFREIEAFQADDPMILSPGYQYRAPLSFVGSILSKVFGLTTDKETRKAYSYILGNTKSIIALDLNQREIATRYNLLKSEIENLHKITETTEFSVSTLAAEFDNKQACRSLQTTIQLSLLKIANALSFAINKKTSPYILSAKELDELATNSRKNKIFMSNKLEDIETNVLQYEQKLLFTFSIPIIEDENLFRIYSVRNFPVYNELGMSFKSTQDLDFMGISVSNRDYIELTPTEYAQCIKASYCKVTSSIAQIDDNSHCTVLSYRNNNQTCPMYQTETKSERPFFATYGNVTLFSAPLTYSARAICPNVYSSSDALNEKIILAGVGSVQIKPGCYIILPDNRKINSQLQPTVYHLGETTIMEAFKYTPKRYNYTFKIHEPRYNYTLPELELMTVSINDVTELWKRSYHPRNAIPVVSVVMTLIFIFISILVIACCCSGKFRHFCRAGCPTENPTKYLKKYKNYHIPTMVKLPEDSRPKKSLKKKLSPKEMQRQLHKRYVRVFNRPHARIQYNNEMANIHASQHEQIVKYLEHNPHRSDILVLPERSQNYRNVYLRPQAPVEQPDFVMRRNVAYPQVIHHNIDNIQNRDLPMPGPDQFTPRSPLTTIRFPNDMEDVVIDDSQ